MDDVIINKMETIKRCINRVNDVYNDNPRNLEDYTKQDSIILNIHRLCEAGIDIAMHLIAELELGVPQTSREAFTILNEEKIIDDSMTEKLKAMVGFRNIAVHDYQKLNLKIVQSIIENNLHDVKSFAEIMKEVKKKSETGENEGGI